MLKRLDAQLMLDLETYLPTVDGFIKLKDLKLTDQLFDEQGNICTITKLYPINSTLKTYKLTFDDGSIVNACSNHSWIAFSKKDRKNNKSPSIKSTQEIVDNLKVNKNQETNYSIPNIKPVNYTIKDLLIDPYVLGCWLGDGQSSTGSIECADKEILSHIVARGYSINPTKKSNESKSSNYRIGDLILTNHSNKVKIGILTKQLKELKLINNKHIPDLYSHASYEQRLNLLQGLLDTDGTCSNGYCEFTSVIPALSCKVLELACSLGIKASMSRNKSSLNNIQYKDRYRVHFITKLPVFKLQRKLNNLKKSDVQITRNTHRYIVGANLISAVPMRSISVSSNSTCYLITKSFISTYGT